MANSQRLSEALRAACLHGGLALSRHDDLRPGRGLADQVVLRLRDEPIGLRGLQAILGRLPGAVGLGLSASKDA